MNCFVIFCLIACSLCEYTERGQSQYGIPEILEHERHREILRHTKTTFLPETSSLMKHPSYVRDRRNHICNIFGPKTQLCHQLHEEVVFGRNTDIVKRAESDIFPKITNKSEAEADGAQKGSISVVKLSVITQADNQELPEREEQQIFWHNQMKKEEVRTLQGEIMKRYMDPNVNPCEDFYGYACGNWKNYLKIPPDRSSFDTFEVIRQNLDHVLVDLLQERSCPSKTDRKRNLKNIYRRKTAWNNTVEATDKAKFFFVSCMNEELINRRGCRPLLDTIEELGGWPLLKSNRTESGYDLFMLLARLRLLNNNVLISQWIAPDMKNAKQYIVHIDQTSLGLPTRDYFLNPRKIKYIRAYKNLIIGTAKLLGANMQDNEKDVDDIVDFEIGLAEIMAFTEEKENVSEIYLKTDLSSITLHFPQYNWKSYFNIVLGSQVDLRTPVAVYCVKYLLELVHLLSNTDHKIVQNYVIWRFMQRRLNNLDLRFLELIQRFNFVLYGREKQPPRWQFCVTQVNTHMGMAIGSLFVRKYFDQTSKNDTIQITQALIASFKGILKESTWIDPHTKTYANMKIENMDLKIGFPDFVLNETELSMRYYDVDIHPEFFFENVLSTLRHLSRCEHKRLGSEVNRTLWSTSPAVVNAYYNRNKNQIMFPAGILQPPFYHKHFPKALNFGGIGVVIGHEITHGFDDKGRLFDQQGNLMMWWRDTSIRNFHKKVQCMIDQYSRYVLPQIRVPIDGYLTQSENIADNGGLKEAFKAYEAWLHTNEATDETMPGLNLTPKQLFFLNFAQVWCGQQRVEEAKNRVITSVHSPGIFRVIGVLSNSEDFAREFSCPLNAPMNPEKKCAVW
ncbi:neprilysin-4-like isoform X2 [Euwallacea fornicatus]|uniref:neprilysin-4-like isoform X2 n=1 Tax=Euwallacea fornicatus TaxID=995702 RepID=UPI00338E19C5